MLNYTDMFQAKLDDLKMNRGVRHELNIEHDARAEYNDLIKFVSTNLAELFKQALLQGDTAMMQFVSSKEPMTDFFRGVCSEIDIYERDADNAAADAIAKIALNLITKSGLQKLGLSPTQEQFDCIRNSFLPLRSPFYLAVHLGLADGFERRLSNELPPAAHPDFLNVNRFTEQDFAVAFLMGGSFEDGSDSAFFNQRSAPAHLVANPVLSGWNRKRTNFDNNPSILKSHLIIDLKNRDLQKTNPRLATLEVLVAHSYESFDFSILGNDRTSEADYSHFIDSDDYNASDIKDILSVCDMALSLGSDPSNYKPKEKSQMYSKTISSIQESESAADIAYLISNAKYAVFSVHNRLSLDSLMEISDYYEAGADRIDELARTVSVEDADEFLRDLCRVTDVLNADFGSEFAQCIGRYQLPHTRQLITSIIDTISDDNSMGSDGLLDELAGDGPLGVMCDAILASKNAKGVTSAVRSMYYRYAIFQTDKPCHFVDVFYEDFPRAFAHAERLAPGFLKDFDFEFVSSSIPLGQGVFSGRVFQLISEQLTSTLASKSLQDKSPAEDMSFLNTPKI